MIHGTKAVNKSTKVIEFGNRNEILTKQVWCKSTKVLRRKSRISFRDGYGDPNPGWDCELRFRPDPGKKSREIEIVVPIPSGRNRDFGVGIRDGIGISRFQHFREGEIIPEMHYSIILDRFLKPFLC